MPGKFLSESGERVCQRWLPVGDVVFFGPTLFFLLHILKVLFTQHQVFSGVFLALWGVLPMMERGAGGE